MNKWLRIYESHIFELRIKTWIKVIFAVMYTTEPWLVSSVGRALHRYCRSHGFNANPVQAWIFFRPYFHYCSNSVYYFEDNFHLNDQYIQQALLYCDGNGQFYQIKAQYHVKQLCKTKQRRNCSTENKPKTTSTQKPKYTPPQHVHQLTPDYSMLFSKSKRKRRKRDDSLIWFSGVGSSASNRKHKWKKKKKQVYVH